MASENWLAEASQFTYQLFFGNADKLSFVLVVFMIADYVTGVCAGWHNKALSSKVGMKGITKKIAIFMLVCVSHVLDAFLGLNDILRSATILFYASNEGISILENVKRLNLPLPEKLQSVIKYLGTQEQDDSSKE